MLSLEPRRVFQTQFCETVLYHRGAFSAGCIITVKFQLLSVTFSGRCLGQLLSISVIFLTLPLRDQSLSVKY